MNAGGFLAGRPEDIIEQLKAVEKRYPGLDRVICAPQLGTPLGVQLEDLDGFAKDVIPAFRGARASRRRATTTRNQSPRASGGPGVPSQHWLWIPAFECVKKLAGARASAASPSCALRDAPEGAPRHEGRP